MAAWSRKLNPRYEARERHQRTRRGLHCARRIRNGIDSSAELEAHGVKARTR